ncbi:MAG TPA: hypothetical protein VF787_05700 [Thermoanaerobaculia bacterium]
MSKTNPNQQYYKVGGRSQSDGPDKMHANENDDKPQPRDSDSNATNAEHPAALRAKKK